MSFTCRRGKDFFFRSHGKQRGERKYGRTQRQVNAMPNHVLGVRIPRDNGQDQIVRSGNNCCSPIRLASLDENKNMAIERLP